MRCCGVARFAYNWGLNRWQEMYEAHKDNPESCQQPNQYILRKELNAIKREEFPWMCEVTKYAPQQALINIGKAFDSFFKGRGRYPKFKRKGEHDSFYIGSDLLKVDKASVWIPGLMRFMGKRRKLGWVRMAEPLRYGNAKIVCSTVSRTADKWYIAITCEVPDTATKKSGANGKVVGVDVGVNEYVTSDGEFMPVPRALRKAQRKLRRAQQSLSRKRKGSKNMARQKAKVARIHARVANVRSDWMHKLTSELTNEYDVIAIEDLNAKGMTKNHHLAMSVTDAAFGEFRRQIEYKSEARGCMVYVADRWYPSSKTCSCCGSVKAKLSLSERTYVCDECGFTCHRDLNAAINLRDLAVSSTVTACGEFSASTHGPRHSASNLCEAGRKHQPSVMDRTE
jgi:putative transposase